MTFLLLLNLEFSLNVVAALLTIVGYSINDTVVSTTACARTAQDQEADVAWPSTSIWP